MQMLIGPWQLSEGFPLAACNQQIQQEHFEILPVIVSLILVSVGLAALIISVVTVHIWTRTKGEASYIQEKRTSRLRLIMVSVGLAALIITVVTVNIWTRAKGSKAQTEENM
ncbi:hypothetical protein F7725_020008, partial [Dissostichus mawsoni]